MRQISDDRRHALQVMSTQLEEFASARRDLLLQLEDLNTQLGALDARATATRIKHNTLHNLDAATSEFPDEVLAMIFEEGMNGHKYWQVEHFGVLVSHVSHRWRDVALSTPTLWINVQFFSGIARSEERAEIWEERPALFFSRARMLPVNIYIEGFHRDRDFTPGIFKLINSNIDRCRHLHIETSLNNGLMNVLDFISMDPVPVLQSIRLGSDTKTNFREPLFSSGAPCLTTAQLDGLGTMTMHFCIPAFVCLESLRLTNLYISEVHEYHAFRDGLMALPSLTHLEMEWSYFIFALDSPIVLPTIRFLHVDCYECIELLGSIIGSIQASSLTTLSLTVGSDLEDLAEEIHYPLLDHLILANATENHPDFGFIALKFPNIKRLTVFAPLDPFEGPVFIHDSGQVLEAVLSSIVVSDIDEGGDSSGQQKWNKLQTIAVLAPNGHVNPMALQSKILELQAARHPIRQLMLPKEAFTFEEVDPVELRTIVEIVDFYVDTPSPFEWDEPGMNNLRYV